MKSIILFAVALLLLSTFSCKKTYTCYCANYTAGTDTSFTIQARNSTQAVDNCYWQTLGHSATCVFQ